MGTYRWDNRYADWIMTNYTKPYDYKLSFWANSSTDNNYIDKAQNKGNEKMMSKKIKKIILNNPATVIYWSDNSRTVVKCMDGDKYNPFSGIAMAFMKGVLDKKTYNKLKKAAENENTIVLD